MLVPAVLTLSSLINATVSFSTSTLAGGEKKPCRD